MGNYYAKLERVFQMGLEVSNVKDIDVLLEKILTEARSLVNADAGSIYIKEEDRLKFSYAQNETLRARLPPGRKLPYSTFSIPISNTSIAGQAAWSGQILNIPDVYQLPEDVSYAFDPKYDTLTGYHTKSMLTVPLKDNREEIIGVLQIINARDDRGQIVSFDAEELPLFMHFANNAAIAIERAQMTRKTILRMIKLAELRDPYETAPHASRVASYSMEIFETWAHRKEMPQKEIDTLKDILKVAALLHDVGKVAISDIILQKPGKLTEEEYDAIKAHTYLGARLFAESNSDLDQAASSVALNHHERWDGLGYPGHIDLMTGRPLETRLGNGHGARGKRGHEIPIFGRIVAVADVYDALLSRRSYKEAWAEEDVLVEVRKCSGTRFDPEVAAAFTESLDDLHQVAKQYPY